MATVTGADRILKEIGDRIRSVAEGLRPVVAVGYSTAYALWVHENIEMKWRGFPRDMSVRKGKDGVAYYGYSPGKAKGLFWGPNGQAKFLEQPFRELSRSGVLTDIIVRAIRGKASLAKAILIAGLRVQRESQKLVPIDTGTLKNSAFTVLETGGQPAGATS